MNTLSSMLKFLGETLGANPNTLKTTDKTLVGGINGAWEIVYPVGSYYETSDASFDPNVSWGGTWVLEDAGKVHLGAGTDYTIGATGGSTTHLHSTGDFTLGVNHIPSHYHGIAQDTGSGTTFSGWHYELHINNQNGPVYNRDSTVSRATSATSTVGGGQAHNHGDTGSSSSMPPYIVVNRWHRTA